MALKPIRRAVIRAFLSKVGADASTHSVQLVTAAASLGFKQVPAFRELRHIGDVAFLVASAAGGANVVLCQQRILPELHVAVCVFLVGGQALPAMANGTAEPGRNVGTKSGVITERLRRVLHGRIVDTQMAGGAAINALQAREQCLVNLRRRGENGGLCNRVGFALRLKLQKVLLISLPRWRIGLPRRGQYQRQRNETQRKEELLQSPFHYSAPETTCTHGGTIAQPGPRKKVPITIRARLATTKKVNSQRINLRSAGRRLGFLSRYGIAISASTIKAGATTPPRRAEWLTSSCRPRKYHGALAGFGVFAGLASSSRGAFRNSDMVMMVVTVAISTTASRTKAYGYEKTVSASSSGVIVSKMGLPVTTSMRP